MHRLFPFCCAAALVGCATSADTKVDTSAAAATASRPLALSDVAGRWRVRALSVRGDSLTSYELLAAADTAGWTLTFPNRPAMPLRVLSVAGDSIVTETGPYSSVLRRTVPVRVLRGVVRLDAGRLVGTFDAHYETDRPDSVLYGRLEGSRIP
jgi:hypothetical protein